MWISIAAAAIIGVIVAAELGRTLLAKLFGYPPERVPVVKLMKLPGIRGATGFRLALILSGPVTAYLAISIVAFAYYGCYGMPSGDSPRMVESAKLGADGVLQGGDRIVEVDGAPFGGGSVELSHKVNAKGGAPIALAIERAGERKTVSVTPTKRDDRWMLGVVLRAERDFSKGTAARTAIGYPVVQATHVGRGLVVLFKGEEKADPGGPVRIVQEFSSTIENDGWQLAFAMTLGVYALLVLSMFDIGRVIFLLLFRS